jgi:hypothetical protein
MITWLSNGSHEWPDSILLRSYPRELAPGVCGVEISEYEVTGRDKARAVVVDAPAFYFSDEIGNCVNARWKGVGAILLDEHEVSPELLSMVRETLRAYLTATDLPEVGAIDPACGVGAHEEQAALDYTLSDVIGLSAEEPEGPLRRVLVTFSKLGDEDEAVLELTFQGNVCTVAERL